MLDILRRVVQEVNTAKDLNSALDIIVSRIQAAMTVQVCSVYLLDPVLNRYVLMATEGLNKSAVGMVSLGPSEGLVGLIGQREEPLNLEDAPSHPKYRYLADTGEERFHSFLGVPIIHQRRILGVLVIQQAESRRFDESEEAFLVTMSAQLSGVIAHAEATGAIRGFSASGQVTLDTKFNGVPAAPGVAIGPAVVIYPTADLDSVPDKHCEDSEVEVLLFNSALKQVRQDMQRLGDNLASELRPEEQALFDVYIRMLDDAALGAEVISFIRQGHWAQGALRQVIQEHVGHFEKMDDPYLRERATDVKDLGRRVLACLQEAAPQQLAFPEPTILISEELTPTMLGEIPKDKLLGLISVKGSGNSHVAILARAMGVPTVMGAVDLPYTQLDGRELIIDGFRGLVYTNSSPALLKQYQDIVEEERQLTADLECLKDEPCETPDHHRVKLWVNTGLMTDVMRSLDRGAEGVGLYRTEVPFMTKECFPSEQEQTAIYREQLEAFAPRPVTMRTLDIGGDKSLPYFPIAEENPFLGWRGIRVTLDHPEIFMVQVRAMLKAGHGIGNLRILLPMVTSITEVDEALHLIHRAYYEVKDEGFDIEMPPVGVMIEVPATVYQARQIARRVDFLSVGSNDLTQYILAVDRNNARVADLYQSFHPAVLQALRYVVDAAHKEGKLVSICGEMAGDPAAAILLIAMGYDVLSMNAANLLKVKWAVRNVPLEKARQLLSDVMQMDSALVVRSCMELALKKSGVTVTRNAEKALDSIT